ncbi:hypothetical protein M885DRAFT_499675 [Pelagophyceae sp. CCMP2097]|nr:hypothetical protein M885DRAFT_499675 [Pelagophyceae sp. CCMP2097]
MGLPRFAVLALLAAVLYFFVSPRRGASEAGTYYAALGLSPTADVKAIRAAFKLQALRSHPDKLESRRKALSAKIGVLGRLWRAATDADRTEAAQFLRISEAVDVLADDDRRAAYDLQLEADRARREQSRAGQGRPMAYYLGNSVPRSVLRLIGSHL